MLLPHQLYFSISLFANTKVVLVRGASCSGKSTLGYLGAKRAAEKKVVYILMQRHRLHSFYCEPASFNLGLQVFKGCG